MHRHIQIGRALLEPPRGVLGHLDSHPLELNGDVGIGTPVHGVVRQHRGRHVKRTRAPGCGAIRNLLPGAVRANLQREGRRRLQRAAAHLEGVPTEPISREHHIAYPCAPAKGRIVRLHMSPHEQLRCVLPNLEQRRPSCSPDIVIVSKEIGDTRPRSWLHFVGAAPRRARVCTRACALPTSLGIFRRTRLATLRLQHELLI
mmetsp:Transcript_9929/g.27728  ORF Transcript_9929/g.27728 Transcript_9929/m.27728 type:complete len:202 (+) Transcript_9929:379-984(+)